MYGLCDNYITGCRNRLGILSFLVKLVRKNNRTGKNYKLKSFLTVLKRLYTPEDKIWGHEKNSKGKTKSDINLHTI